MKERRQRIKAEIAYLAWHIGAMSVFRQRQRGATQFGQLVRWQWHSKRVQIEQQGLARACSSPAIHFQYIMRSTLLLFSTFLYKSLSTNYTHSISRSADLFRNWRYGWERTFRGTKYSSVVRSKISWRLMDVE